VGFTSLIFLAALPLVAIPVLIHLYRGRQRDVILWGAMQFLTQATTKGRSMERFEELLLLALRVGAILALVLALAQPVVRSAWLGTGTDSEVVLVIDNSLSMSRTVDNFSAWDRLKDNVREVLGELGSGDRVQVMLASGGGEWLTAEGIDAGGDGISRLETLIDSAEPTLGTAGLLDSLQRVIHSDVEGNPKYRRVVVFTDNQKNSWQLDDGGSWRQLETARQEAPVPTAIEIIDCGLEAEQFENLAVMQLETARKSVQPQERMEFSATVENVGQVASQSATLEWLIDDEVVATSLLAELQPHESTNSKTTLESEEVGNYAVSCRIDSQDQIALDQQTSVVVEVADSLPVLLVHDQQYGETDKSAKELLMASLGYENGEAQPWHSVYQPEVVATNRLANKTLSDYRCIVITNLSDIDAEIVERLSEYVGHGGGLWVGAGSQTNREVFNQIWYDEGQGLSPVAIGALDTIDDTNEPAGMIHPPEQSHPATAQLSNTTQLDIDEARLYEHWQFDVDQQDESLSVVLASGDGSPLVIENYLGQGRVMVQAFPLGLEWTNLPQLKSYVVMVHDWLDYLTAGSTARFNITPGSSIVASTPKEATFSTAVLHTPDGREHPLVVQNSAAGTTIFRYSQTQQPGLYRVAFESGGETVASLPYSVARDTSESQWGQMTEEDHEKLTAVAELDFEADSTVAAELAQTVPPEEPLWGALLLALLMLLAGELLLSNWLGRQRSGVAVSTS